MIMDYFFNEALKQAEKSSYKVKLGAVVVYRNKIVGKGYNITLSTGQVPDGGDHAEISAIKNTTAKFRKNSTLIVGRRNKLGELALAKPCYMCEVILRKVGVKHVWYSIEGGWEKMTL